LCGWYPVPDVPSVQKHLRDVGMKLIPQYQRDLPDDDPAKIHFRFYLIDEANIRGALSCHEGLVMVPVSVVNRVQNESQLAAVLADGVAASLQRGQARYAIDWKVAAGEVGLTLLAAAADSWGLNLASSVGEEAMKRSILRKLEDQRGRIALSLLADAGYDPWQAPEAWRLLVPDKLPNNPAKLKYPHISDYQLGILGFAYKRAAPGVATVTTAAQ
jgi:predicted Zn-dependent protease